MCIRDSFVHRTVKLPDGTEVSGFTETTVGLLIFNAVDVKKLNKSN